MKVQPDCYHCCLRQVLESVRFATDDPKVHQQVMLEALEVMKSFDYNKTSPIMGRAVHKLVEKHTGVKDPYQKVKEESIAVALELYPSFKKFVAEQEDKLSAAIQVSALGNLLDAAAYGDLRQVDWEKVFQNELAKNHKLGDIEKLRGELKAAKSVLIIGDNAGETVFDRILAAEIKAANEAVEVFYGVRGYPIINDATMQDAIHSGLGEETTIVDTGSSAPGLVLKDAPAEFLKLYNKADVVISKGQGNYEILEEDPKRPIYFLLKAKCSTIAAHLGVDLDTLVFLQK
ncbi:MAG TPA: DUF89 family protein, partial [Firmicutes bacterium]|nr:DUF89 family protein [Bacillota bacterium]